MSGDENLSKLKLILEYDGANYSGWAKAPTNPKPSIQEKIEKSWKTLFNQTTFLSIKSSSRTDAGVHALGQVVTIESDIIFGDISAMKTERVKIDKKSKNSHPNGKPNRRQNIDPTPGTAEEAFKRLNSFLPDDIVFRSSKLVHLDFSAKDHSRRRMYRYEILNHSNRSAIGRQYHWYIKHSLDISLMSKAAEMMIGTHNMSCFVAKPYIPQDLNKVIKKIETVR
jgi:tRNA pseudouridine38-40 synthase